MSTLSASFELTPVASSVPTARHVVVALLKAWEVPHDLDDAALLISELVSNVVDHVGGDATLTVEIDTSGDWLRIGVLDGSAIRPVVRELERDRPRGRGSACCRRSPPAGATTRSVTASGSGSSSVPGGCDLPPGLAARPSGDAVRVDPGDRPRVDRVRTWR